MSTFPNIKTYINTLFSTEEWIAQRRALFAQDVSTISLIPEYQRLPANIHIIEFLYALEPVFQKWLEQNNYSGEKVVLTQKHPDIIYSSDVESGGTITNDSPHKKIPRSIVFEVEQRSPLSTDPPFSGRKNWGFRTVGEVKGEDGYFYQIRVRRYESLVRFTVYAQTPYETERLRYMFDTFMSMCTGVFQKMGVEKMVYYDWPYEKTTDTTSSGMVRRITRYWFVTDEFFVIGPLAEITPEIEAVVIDTSEGGING